MKTAVLSFLTLFLSVAFWGANAQNETSVIHLPKDRLMKPLLLDPNEALTFGALASYWQDGEYKEKVYMPASIGFYRSLIRWGRSNPMEIGIDIAAQFQFEWVFPEGKSQRNLLNTDYKISLLYHLQLSDAQHLRIRFYHVSSHLGDDYMIRNGVHSYFPNPNNYEQLDATWLKENGSWQYYGGIGMVVRPETIRARFSVHAGFLFDLPKTAKLPTGLVGGAHLRLLAENNYNPGIKTGLGWRIGEISNRPIRFMLEFYRGNLPYSPFEFQKVQWLGLGMYFQP